MEITKKTQEKSKILSRQSLKLPETTATTFDTSLTVEKLMTREMASSDRQELPLFVYIFYKLGYSCHFFLFFVFSSVKSKYVHYKILPMTGFEPRRSGIGSIPSAN